MIEKFSPEEIAILKKDLSDMPKDIQKRNVQSIAVLTIGKLKTPF